jgi:hypothetical protein
MHLHASGEHTAREETTRPGINEGEYKGKLMKRGGWGAGGGADVPAS